MGVIVMKNFQKFSLMAMAAMAIISCNKEVAQIEKPEQDILVRVFTAFADDNIKSDTKTSLDGVSVVWNEGDAITVYDEEINAYPSAALTSADFNELTNKVEFKVAGMPQDAEVFYAVYPSGVSTGNSQNFDLTISFPCAQVATAGSFGPKANIAIAATPEEGEGVNDLQFYNIGGILALTISSDHINVSDIASVRLSAGESKAMSGTITTSGVSNENIEFEVTEGKNYVELVGSFTNGSTYYFCVLPGTYGSTAADDNRLKITFTKNDGSYIEYTIKKELTVERNSNINIGSINIQKDWQNNIDPNASNYVLYDEDGAFEDGGKYILALQDAKNGTYWFIKATTSDANATGTEANPNMVSSALTVTGGVISGASVGIDNFIFTASAITVSSKTKYQLKNDASHYLKNSSSSSTSVQTYSSGADSWEPTFLDTGHYKLVSNSNSRFLAKGTNSYSIKAYNQSFTNQHTLNPAANLAQYHAAITVFKLGGKGSGSVSTYSVTYDSNGATGGEVPTDSRAYLSGANAIVAGNIGNLEKTGYTFAGWNTAANGSGTTYQPGDFLPISNADVTLYAQWTVNKYKVTIVTTDSDSNDWTSKAQLTITDSNSNVINDGDEVDYNTVLTLLVTPNRGYEFRNWQYNNSSRWNSLSTNGGTHTVTADVSFRLNVNTLTPHHVTVANSIEGCESIVAKRGEETLNAESVVYKGEAISISATAASGYGFSSWVLPGSITDADASSAETTFTMPDTDVELNATFGAIYSITLDGNGGTINASPLSAAAGATITLSVVTVPDGMTFSSWKILDSGDNDITSSITFDNLTGNTFTMPAKNIKVSVVWETQTSTTPDRVTLSGQNLQISTSGLTSGNYADHTYTDDAGFNWTTYSACAWASGQNKTYEMIQIRKQTAASGKNAEKRGWIQLPSYDREISSIEVKFTNGSGTSYDDSGAKTKIQFCESNEIGATAVAEDGNTSTAVKSATISVPTGYTTGYLLSSDNACRIWEIVVNFR